MAYDNLVLTPSSVVEVLKATPLSDLGIQGSGNLYGMFNAQNRQPTDGGPVSLQEQSLSTVRPDGQVITHTMGLIDRYDIKIFADDLDTKLRTYNPFVKWLFAKNAVPLANLMRGVNYYSKAGFKGAISSGGNALDLMLLRAEQFSDPTIVVATLRTSWLATPGAAGSLQFIIANDGGAVGAKGPLVARSAVPNSEAIAILGFANPSGRPCVSGFQPTYNTVVYDVQNLSYELTDDEYGYPMIELAQPLLIWPGESAAISVRYFQGGRDELQPIGMWIKTSTNMATLATA
jgi:hypothetical protein